MACEVCGATTVYVEEVFGEVCTDCGTLVNMLQAEDLVAEPVCDDYGRLLSGTRVEHDPIRSAMDGRVVYGAKKTIEAHASILRLLQILKRPGLEARAKSIFDRGMKAGKFRWGRTSALVEGASVAIALRESGRCECLHDIAVYTSVKFIALARMYFKVQKLLDLQSPPSDAVLYFSSLFNFINTGLSSTPSSFPPKLHTYLESTAMTDVSRFAVSLSSLTQRVSLFDRRAVSPVACALVICAYEGVAGQAMPQHTLLASKLSGRAGCGQRTVLERYQEIGRLIRDWSNTLPWAKALGTGVRTGSRIRSNNARAMSDAVDFQQEIWNHKVRPLCQGGSVVDDISCFGLEEDDSSSDAGSADDPAAVSGSVRATVFSNEQSQVSQPLEPVRPPAYVRDRAGWCSSHWRTLEQMAASSLYLGSLSGSAPSFPNLPSSLGKHSRFGVEHLSKDVFLRKYPRSRLSKLAESRGGEQFIETEELFEAGELEGFIRHEREVLVLKAKWDVEQVDQ